MRVDDDVYRYPTTQLSKSRFTIYDSVAGPVAVLTPKRLLSSRLSIPLGLLLVNF